YDPFHETIGAMAARTARAAPGDTGAARGGSPVCQGLAWSGCGHVADGADRRGPLVDGPGQQVDAHAARHRAGHGTERGGRDLDEVDLVVLRPGGVREGEPAVGHLDVVLAPVPAGVARRRSAQLKRPLEVELVDRVRRPGVAR